ncbi:Zn-ribbon domain-containing OB-fold protein [Streptomyces sp. NPDC057253]|uniref:Zn-ribbon domain-containing OB-fold protein n=1 Tax=Streptomyces sp. NPDC057253 TaxID=3346069 RepID=UPI0036324303
MSAVLSRALPAERVHIATDRFTEPFWQAARERRLVAPRCGDCGHFRLPPTPFCPECQSQNIDWTELSGRGSVFSFSVVRNIRGLDDDVVLVAAVVDLPDAPGARLVSNVIDADPDEVRIGMELTVDFTPVSDGWLLPVFRPLTEAREGEEGSAA